jgi:hypothetical protein
MLKRAGMAVNHRPDQSSKGRTVAMKRFGRSFHPKTPPYRNLSDAETDALVEALSDGFGDVFVQGRIPLPLPSGVKSGLLGHFFYCRAGSEYDGEDFDRAFWSSANGDDAPSPYEVFPLQFHRRRLRVYFQN